MILTPEEAARRFSHHPPRDEATVRQHESVRDRCRSLAELIDQACPDGREKALALTHLEDAMMWSNAAIARGQS